MLPALPHTSCWQHGTSWAAIQADAAFSGVLAGRSQVNMKDKWRNMCKIDGTLSSPAKQARSGPKPSGKASSSQVGQRAEKRSVYILVRTSDYSSYSEKFKKQWCTAECRALSEVIGVYSLKSLADQAKRSAPQSLANDRLDIHEEHILYEVEDAATDDEVYSIDSGDEQAYVVVDPDAVPRPVKAKGKV